jgi:putative ABC transport system permease protein
MTWPSDIRYSARSLLRNPGFTIIGILTLALGIGANTAIFSVVDSVLLRSLPFPEPDRLVSVSETRLDRGWEQMTFTHANFWDMRDRNRTFEAIGAFRYGTLNLTGVDSPERLGAARVSEGFFRALRVTPVAGRVFAPGEDEANAENRVVVLSHRLWSSRFGSDPAVIGRSLRLDGESYTVIGVLPRGGSWLDEADVFVPLVHRADADRDSFELLVLGRLSSGTTVDAARADLTAIAQQLAQLYPADKGMGIDIQPSSVWVASDTLRRALWVLLGAVGFLLLIACVNLANLLLARATTRTRERALRAALGASRGRIVRLILTESLLVGLLGGALGIALAQGIIGLLRVFDPGDIPRLADVNIDGRVLAVTTLVAVVTSIVTGLIPALRTPYLDLVVALREGERSVMGQRRLGRLRSVLVGAEVALSLVLLIGAGLLVRSFGEVVGVERGFQTQDRLMFEVGLPASYNGERTAQFLAQFLSRVNSLQNVSSTAAVSMRPLRGVGTGMGIAAPDKPAPPDDAVPWASWRLISRDYFRTIGVPILEGRDFTEQDLISKPWRAIVSRSVATRLWPGENALGRQLIIWKGQSQSIAEIIGIVGDMRDWGLAGNPSLAVYLPYYGAGFSPVQFVVHSQASLASLAPQLRSLLREMDAELPMSDLQSFDDMVGDSIASRRFTMLLLAAFAALALLLALAGVYGVLSYSVSRRKAEIGMRLALGASPAGVMRLIVGQGMRPVFVGLVLGLGGALALSRLMTGLLFGITPADVLTYVAVAAALTVAAAFSCYLPARQALRVDVMTALREE